MLSLIPLLLGMMIVFINPFLLLPIVIFFLVHRYVKGRSRSGRKHDDIQVKSDFSELIYPRVNVKSFREKIFNVNLRISVSRCIATYSIGLGRYLLLGAIVFRNIKNESLLREIILNLPVDFSFSFIRRVDSSGDLYLLCIRVKASFQNYDDKASMLIGILNSLATTIPADEIKILENRDLISSILNLNLGRRLWR